MVDKTRGDPLHSIPPRLVHRLTGRHVSGDRGVVECDERDLGTRDRHTPLLTTHDRDTGQYLMRTTRQPPEHRDGIIAIARLAQHLPIDDDDRIGAEHESVVVGSARDRGGLREGDASHKVVGRFVIETPLVDTRWFYLECVAGAGQ